MRRAAQLSGFTVAVTGGPGTYEQVSWFARRGARVLVAPVGEVGGGDEPAGEGPRPGRDGGEVSSAVTLVDLICRGSVHAVTFAAGSAVKQFMAAADGSRRGRNVLSALNRAIVVACPDRACSAVAREEGIDRVLVPDDQSPGSMVGLVRDELLSSRRRLLAGPNEIVLQGSAVLVDGWPVSLSDTERAVLTKLAEHPGATVSRRVLLRHVWKDPSVGGDVLDRAVERLRDELGPTGGAVELAARRGYRFRAVRAPSKPG
ncbi:MAG: winged helix-turn-helix domain-containing protein [Acidobacteriota bacterium]|nr:winged helix-turn-helix domain-containing protein [Acidobacteriota bacterium]